MADETKKAPVKNEEKEVTVKNVDEMIMEEPAHYDDPVREYIRKLTNGTVQLEDETVVEKHTKDEKGDDK